jgi:hypothetical protein
MNTSLNYGAREENSAEMKRLAQMSSKVRTSDLVAAFHVKTDCADVFLLCPFGLSGDRRVSLSPCPSTFRFMYKV